MENEGNRTHRKVEVFSRSVKGIGFSSIGRWKGKGKEAHLPLIDRVTFLRERSYSSRSQILCEERAKKEKCKWKSAG